MDGVLDHAKEAVDAILVAAQSSEHLLELQRERIKG